MQKIFAAAFLAVALISGCGTGPMGFQQGRSAPLSLSSLSAESPQSEASFYGHAMGWDFHTASNPIVDDLKARESVAQSLLPGFNLQGVTSTASVDLRPLMSPVADQAMIGACSAFAVAKGLGEFLELKWLKEGKAVAPWDHFVPLSAKSLYFSERRFTHTVGQDSGGYTFLAVKLMTDDGIPPEVLDPDPYPAQTLDKNFVNYYLTATPSADAYGAARTCPLRGRTIKPIATVSQIKESLNEGYPVAFGVLVFRSTFGPAAKDGNVAVPDITQDGHPDGHIVLAVGYDDARQVLIVRNSWGTDWGDKGYFYLPYSYFDKPLGLALAYDAWTIR